MRIYGITYDHTTNYGTCFQACALQMAIESIEVFGEKIEYILIPIATFSDWPGNCRSIIKNNRFLSLKQIKLLNKRILYYCQRIKFKKFHNERIKYCQASNMNELSLLNQKADAFVCGSDVIWNMKYNRGVSAFFLDFAEKYKFSYAASFGKAKIDDKEGEMTARFLSSFNEISCREKSGCEIIKKYTGRQAIAVADPVILVSRNEWDRIAGPKTVSGKYIFVYVTHINGPVMSFVNMLEKQTGLKVVFSIWGSAKALLTGKTHMYSPEKWLQLLRDAEYVVTNSFHATVFCTLFHKNFFTVVKGEKAGGINVRMYDYLSSVGLEDRMYSSVPDAIDLNEINYENTDRVLGSMREESMIFLRRNLEAAYREKTIAEKKQSI